MIPTRIKLTHKNMKIVKFASLEISKLLLHYLIHNKTTQISATKKVKSKILLS